MNLKYILILIIVLVTSFTIGVYTTNYWLEPVPTIYKIYKFLKGNNQVKKIKNYYEFKKNKVDNRYFYEKNIDNEIGSIKNIYNSLDVIKTRNSLINNYILPDSIVKIEFLEDQSLSCYKNPTIIETNFYGIKQRGVLEKTENEKKTSLIIYIHGHDGDPCKAEYYNQIKNNFKDSDYDFLSFSMFGLGINSFDSLSFPIRFPLHKNSYTYENYDKNSLSLLEHSAIQYFFDENHPEKKPLSIFLSSPYHIINKLISKYDYNKIIIMGISGGSWYSTILSGLIPEINHLFSFNGTLPLFYRIETDSKGDFENIFADLWKKHDYYTFYFLSLYDKNSELNRTSHHIYSEYDECCFSKPEIDYFKKSMDTMEIQNLNVKIFEGVLEHSIDVNWITKQIKFYD